MNIGTTLLNKVRNAIDGESQSLIVGQPLVVSIHANSAAIEARVNAFDTLGIALSGLVIQNPIGTSRLDDLARTVCERITYLWEPLMLIEYDLDQRRADMRSAPPFVDDEVISYYEGQLTEQNGSASLKLSRFAKSKHAQRRSEVPLTLTHEAFRRLVDDLHDILQDPDPR